MQYALIGGALNFRRSEDVEWHYKTCPFMSIQNREGERGRCGVSCALFEVFSVKSNVIGPIEEVTLHCAPNPRTIELTKIPKKG